mgnify:CR=1 FL=1
MSDRRLGAALLGSIALFLVLYVTAIVLYPGGTWFDRRAPGYDLLRNFVCDLTQPIALDGRPNAVGSVFGKASILAIDAGLSLNFLGALRLGRPTPLLARVVRFASALSFLGIAAVPLLPSLVFGHLHTVAVLIGAAAGLFAGGFCVAVLARSPYRRIGFMGMAMFAVAFLDAGIYAWSVSAGTTPLALPVLQRLALVLIVVWMTAVGVALRVKV